MEGKKRIKVMDFLEQTGVTEETAGNSLPRKLFQKPEKPNIRKSEDEKSVDMMAVFSLRNIMFSKVCR